MTFGTEKGRGSASAPKADGQEKGQDAQSAKPLSQGAPEQDTAGHVVKAGKNSNTGSGKAAYRLKKGIDK